MIGLGLCHASFLLLLGGYLLLLGPPSRILSGLFQKFYHYVLPIKGISWIE